MRLWSKPKKNYSGFIFLILVAIIIIYIWSVINQKFNPILLSMSEVRAKQIGIQSINQTVNESIKNIKYEDMVNLQKDETGQITALILNTIYINSLKSELTISIQEKLSQIQHMNIEIPFGLLINSEMLAGSGPNIPVRLVPIGTTNTEFKNHFEAQGINQTKHEIYMEVSASIKVLLPTASRTFDVVTNIPISETIILGRVPDTYTNFSGTEKEIMENAVPLRPR